MGWRVFLSPLIVEMLQNEVQYHVVCIQHQKSACDLFQLRIEWLILGKRHQLEKENVLKSLREKKKKAPAPPEV